MVALCKKKKQREILATIERDRERKEKREEGKPSLYLFHSLFYHKTLAIIEEQKMKRE